MHLSMTRYCASSYFQHYMRIPSSQFDSPPYHLWLTRRRQESKTLTKSTAVLHAVTHGGGWGQPYVESFRRRQRQGNVK